MSDITLNRGQIELLINGEVHRNKLQYVSDQAIAGDQVVHILQIRNRVLIVWEKTKFPDCKKNYVDLLNNLIGDGIARFKTDSERLQSRIRVEC